MIKIKNILLFVGVLLALTSCKKDDPSEDNNNASDDYTVSVAGTELINNDERVYNSIDDVDGNMVLDIKNISNSIINLQVKVVSIEGTDGADLELCLGECYYGVEVGKTYPFADGSVAFYSLNPGESSMQGAAHVLNKDDRNDEIVYGLKLYQVDDNGNELTSKKSVNFKYKYVAP